MIKIGKVSISLWILPFVLMSAVTHTLGNAAIAYVVVLVHEFAHFMAARKRGVEVGGLLIMPFGVTLKLKERYIRDTASDMLICIAGPLSNLVMIVIGLVARYNWNALQSYADFFILSNAAIMAINIIPILPLDGGRLLRAYLTAQTGFARACRITVIISYINIFIVLSIGIAALWYTHFNVSLAMLSSFLIFNMSGEKKNNDFVMMQQVFHSPQKLRKEGVMPIRALAVTADISPAQLLKNFSYNHFYIVNVCDDNAAIIGTLSETQIIQAMTESRGDVRLADMLMLQGDKNNMGIQKGCLS